VDKPTSVTKGENETVTFVCNGEGMPRPNPPKWFINGVAFTCKAESAMLTTYLLSENSQSIVIVHYAVLLLYICCC